MNGRNLLLAMLLSFLFGVVHAEVPPAGAPRAPQQTDETAPTEPTEAEQDEDGSFWMEQKLRLSQDILVGLALADFEQMGKSAERMHGLNRVERFVRRGPEGYRDHLRQFNMANQALRRACDEENLEAATLAFNQMTISCVSCHRHLRAE